MSIKVFRGRCWGAGRMVRGGIAVMAGLAVAAAAVLPAQAAGPQARSKPFPAWTPPKINPTMTVAQAKAFVEKHTRADTKWFGPTTGPKAPKGHLVLAWVNANASYTPYIYWGDGVKEAAKILGWKVVSFNGRGTVSGQLKAMQQALAMSPNAIITPANAEALEKPIRKAVSEHIPVIGIHATDFPGPSPKLDLYMNITSNPATIGRAEAAYVIAASNGKVRDVHLLDSAYSIARFKAKATVAPIKNCKGCKLLKEVNLPLNASSRMTSVVSGLVGQYGTHWWMTTCCDGFLPDVAAALRASRIHPGQVRLVGADGPPSAYEMVRKKSYEAATVPEPSTLFGFEAVDAVVRAYAHKPPAHFLQPVHIVTHANVDKEGGDKNQYIPPNNFACYYKNIWLGQHNKC